jgi:glycosyltransferase involved in cell wall biosynthesis
MASGLPVIYTKVGEISVFVSDKKIPGGILPDQVGELISEIEKLMQLSPDDRIKRGSWGRDLALNEFDIDKMVDELINLYSVIIS